NGGGMIPAPAIMPRSMSLSAATPSSSTRQLSTSALSVKRSTSACASISGAPSAAPSRVSAAVLIEPLPGLLAEVAGGDQRLHLLVNEEPIAVGLVQVLGDVEHGVQPEQVGEE